MKGIFAAWGKILAGYYPSLSIEVTKECPLSCPGCYAYGDQHLGGLVTLNQVSDLKGSALVSGVLGLLDKHKPLHVSLVGGEPLVRYRELSELLPQIAARGIHAQVVTSAVRPIPIEWASIPQLKVVVSIDGLQPEHDARRKPATYDRILKHIEGHRITVHCTVTRQQVKREGYIDEFIAFWAGQSTTKQIWMSLYTPQVGEESEEKLQPEDRRRVVEALLRLREIHPKLDMPRGMIDVYANPPQSPAECVFSRSTHCVSADLSTKITPCQFGGNPDCANCGCIASAGLKAIGRHKLPIGITAGAVYDASLKVGSVLRSLRNGRNGHVR